MPILVGFVPSIVARKGIAGREKVSAAFATYYRKGGHNKASPLTKYRYEISRRNGVSIEDTARYELGGSIALLLNTTPGAFWMLLHAFADPELLEDLRQEIGKTMLDKSDQSGRKIIIDITSLKSSCPLLVSTFQEVLRYRAMGTSVREVMEDTVLDGRWLLKKGNMIQMPSRVVHCDMGVWGSDVNDFDPKRFLKPTKANGHASSKVAPAAAMRAFGGGSTLCPGRHFAINEVLALVAMFVMRFDMTPVSGAWTMPTTNNTSAAAVIMEPDHDIKATVSERQGFNSCSWNFTLKTSEDMFALVAEDREELQQDDD